MLCPTSRRVVKTDWTLVAQGFRHGVCCQPRDLGAM